MAASGGLAQQQSIGASIDLNCDVGESFGSWKLPDAQVLDTVSSANIACGFHAGDPLVIRNTLTVAAQRGVSVGAHVGYRDLAGFGRRFIAYDPEQLRAEVLYQLAALDGMARTVGTKVSYVKAHGALYHALQTHPEQAAAVVDAVAEYDDALALLLLPDSPAAELAWQRGLETVAEAFADRAYQGNGSLVPRNQPGAVITDAQQIADAMVQLAKTSTVTAVDGTVVPLRAKSICLHSDTPGAVETAVLVRDTLENAGVGIRSFS